MINKTWIFLSLTLTWKSNCMLERTLKFTWHLSSIKCFSCGFLKSFYIPFTSCNSECFQTSQRNMKKINKLLRLDLFSWRFWVYFRSLYNFLAVKLQENKYFMVYQEVIKGVLEEKLGKCIIFIVFEVVLNFLIRAIQ